MRDTIKVPGDEPPFITVFRERSLFSLMPLLKAICYNICRYPGLTLKETFVTEEGKHVENL